MSKPGLCIKKGTMQKMSAKQLAVLALLVGAVIFASGASGDAVAQDHGHGQATEEHAQPNTSHDEPGHVEAAHGETAHGEEADVLVDLPFAECPELLGEEQQFADVARSE